MYIIQSVFGFNYLNMTLRRIEYIQNVQTHRKLVQHTITELFNIGVTGCLTVYATLVHLIGR